MGFFDKIFSTPIDNILGFNPQKVGISAATSTPGGQTGVSTVVGAVGSVGDVIPAGSTTLSPSTTDPATNTPTPAPAQTSFDRVQSYLNAKAQQAYIAQVRQISQSAPVVTPKRLDDKLVTYGIWAALAWLFLFKGKL